MGVKISELPVASSANNSDSLVLNHGSETQRITLEKLMESGKRAAGLVTDSELQTYLENYVSESHLSDVLDDYVEGADISNYLSEYVTGSDMYGYLSEYVTESDLSNCLSDYVTQDENWITQVICRSLMSNQFSATSSAIT